MKTFGFPKSEHLCLRDDIEQLFGAGAKGVSVFPLRAVFRQVEASVPPVKVLISVSKRRFRHAADRNRVKRQLREAYRHHKDILAAALPENAGLHLGILWLSDSQLSSQQVDERLVKLLRSVAARLSATDKTTERQ